MNEEILKIIELTKDKHTIDKNNSWFKNSQTYLDEIKKELEEVEIELKNDKQVFLEDELGDVLWDYFNFLTNLEDENKIKVKNVFKRCFKKYSERLEGIKKGIRWNETKEKQKQELQKEQEFLDNSSN